MEKFEEIKMVHLEHAAEGLSDVSAYGVERAKTVNDFHRSFPEYSVTPLVELNDLASVLGVKDIYVKDESYRFGLNAFKVLGGSFAIGSYVADKLGVDISKLPYSKMISEETRSKLGDLTIVTATDGNHGRGVAWTANRLGLKSVVYMPKGSAEERLENIRACGAEASITDLNYDDAVRLANEGVEKYGWVLVQDTAWDGYEDVPKWIMQGYTTMGHEIAEQLGGVKPTHIFLQAGVGAMAGAMTAYFSDLYGDAERPVITIVEPDKADCIYRSARAGKVEFVGGDMDSIMAGLCCGEPCTLGWEVMKDHADYFISMPDYVAAEGMRILGNPCGDDRKIISGESGAATTGFVTELLRRKELAWLKEELGLDENSVVLCISTEGDTDRENYRRIVWDGAFPAKTNDQ